MSRTLCRQANRRRIPETRGENQKTGGDQATTSRADEAIWGEVRMQVEGEVEVSPAFSKELSLKVRTSLALCHDSDPNKLGAGL